MKMNDLVHNEERLKQLRERAKELIGQMTLEEKVYQTLYNAPAIERLGIASYNWWNEALHGSVDTASPICSMKSSSNVAAKPIACGKTVAVPALATPCRASFHQL